METSLSFYPMDKRLNTWTSFVVSQKRAGAPGSWLSREDKSFAGISSKAFFFFPKAKQEYSLEALKAFAKRNKSFQLGFGWSQTCVLIQWVRSKG